MARDPYKSNFFAADKHRRHRRPGRLDCAFQRGLVLLLSLALLAGLSLLALLAANSMLQQKQLAANYGDSELARLAAMTAVSAGENYVLSLPNDSRIEGCRSDCFREPLRSGMQYPDQLPVQPEHLPDEWWLQWGQTKEPGMAGNTISGGTEPTSALASRQPPLFIIRELEFLAATGPQGKVSTPSILGIGYYQVLGRGTGLGANSSVVAESIFARPWLADPPETGSAPKECRVFQPGLDCGRLAYRERR